MKQATALLIGAILLVFGGCKKDALQVHSDLEGIWVTEDYQNGSGAALLISKTTESEYSEKHGKSYKGEAKLNNRDELSIGHKKLHMDAWPDYDAEGNYFLELEGKKLIGAAHVSHPTASVNGTAVLFQWAMEVDAAQEVIIEYKRTASTGTWTTINVTASAGQYELLDGLFWNTEYEWRMKSVNGIHSSGYTSVQTFTTH